MRGMKLSFKLPLLIVLSVFVSALIIFALGAYLTRNSLQAVEMEANSNSVHAYASAASFYLEEASSALAIAAALPQITDFASAGLVDPALHGVPADAAMPQRNVAASMLKNSKIFECIMLLRADGTIYLLEPYELQVKTLRSNLAFQNWYQELMSGGKTVISDLLISNATQRPTVTIATPVRNSAGQVIGILAGELKLEAFSKMALGEMEAGIPQRYGYITDSRGLIIAHQAKSKYVQEQTDFSSAPPVRAALAGQHGTMQYVCPIDGQVELGAHTPLPDTGWAIVYVLPAQIAFAPLTRLMYVTLLITVAIAIIVTIVGLVIVRRQITRRLGQLTAAATAMGTGDLSQRVKVTTGDEIGQLGTEFNQMALSLSEKEMQLRESQEFSSSLLDNSTYPMTVINPDTSIRYVNPALERLTGFSPAELIGRKTPYPWWTEEILERFTSDFEDAKRKGMKPIERLFQKKDGIRFWVEVSSAPVIIDGEFKYLAANWVDITERKQMQERLIASERLATLGQFSGNISHELRNPLGVIDSSVYYLKTKLKDADGKVHEHLDRIKLSVGNSTAIIESLLNLTRMTGPALTKLDLTAVIRDAVATSKLPKTVISKLDFPEGEVLVNGDHEQLRMAFKNIIKNASEAMGAGGTLTVTIRTAAEGRAEVSFADTGSGIAAEDLKRVFQPLFSLKAKGIGLGLSITRMVIEKHGGTIEAKSEPGKGATIVIQLPLYADKDKEA